MNPEKLYSIFTEALESDSIRDRLVEIIAAKTADERLYGQTELFPESDASVLSAENASLSRRIALMELEISRLEGEKNALINQNHKYMDSLNNYCSAYAMQISLYERYKTLSPQTAKVVNGFFKNRTLSGLFLCGVLPENLKGLRDYTESLVINGYESKKDDIGILNDLYTYLLSCYNSTFSTPVYSLHETSAGDEFDERFHHNLGTAKSGKITSVLMQGCTAAANSRVIRKTIVRV